MAPPDCQLCEDTTATLFCKQCQENFCQEVRLFHAAHVRLLHLKVGEHADWSEVALTRLPWGSASRRSTTRANGRVTR
jgi:hypothetical protein